MSQEKIIELRERLFYLERKIAPLEWDAGRKQINAYKRLELERLKKEHQLLKDELERLLQPIS